MHNMTNNNLLSIKGYSLIKKFNLLANQKQQLLKESKTINIQDPVLPISNSFAIKTIKKLCKFNPNNLGNWYTKKPINTTAIFEKKVIEQIKNLLKCNSNIEGYISSGSTEGNIFACWSGKKYLEKINPKSKCVLLKTSLSHYSINKAADITDLKIVNIELNKNFWNMDINCLEQKIISFSKKNINNFLISLTLGYTISGSEDDVENISILITKIKKYNKNLNFFIWIDAAFNGLIKPFLTNKKTAFVSNDIKLFTSDFHKFYNVPYPAGIILYNNQIIKNIRRKIPYIGTSDNTLLGSRPGISSLTIWNTINNLGINGCKKIINKCLKEKEDYLKTINYACPGISIRTSPHSINACIIGNNSNEHNILQKTFNLKPINIDLLFYDGITKKTVYKVFFLPKY